MLLLSQVAISHASSPPQERNILRWLLFWRFPPESCGGRGGITRTRYHIVVMLLKLIFMVVSWGPDILP